MSKKAAADLDIPIKIINLEEVLGKEKNKKNAMHIAFFLFEIAKQVYITIDDVV